MTVRLTQYSHGAGCGCKIAPAQLDLILKSQLSLPHFPALVVGNHSKDDAAAIELDNGKIILSTTDFFMPIVDEPFTFGRIAATNAMSDIYAMGGTPLMAVAILGWPINTLPAEIAGKVLDGGRQACLEANIPLAGGHSIDAPEPLFGLAVTGEVCKTGLKTNSQAKQGDRLYLSKPLGVGVLTTAHKQGKLLDKHCHIATDSMCSLNKIGQDLASISGVHAMTDVTGFGLLGHLLEICEGSGLAARLNYSAVPLFESVIEYIQMGCIPGGTERNFKSYKNKVSELGTVHKNLLCDPQTSGGLLICVAPDSAHWVESLLKEYGSPTDPIGELLAKSEPRVEVLI